MMSDTTNRPIIIARNVEKWYGHFQALAELTRARFASVSVPEV
jgi:hypothetical protein